MERITPIVVSTKHTRSGFLKTLFKVAQLGNAATRIRRCTALAAASLILAACANLNTIDRSSQLGGNSSGSSQEGVAVHLDAQQRVVFVNHLSRICAEPSPDALAAYAASIGLGLSEPGGNAASLAGGQQSSAGSIGLRTQSITLMRDALYRMCEAYSNGAVSAAQVATLLQRSQDLTAVILAVEQLTGAVTANQVVLGGSTNATASASLLSNQDLLDAARQDETEKQNQLLEARGQLESARAELEKRERAERTARDTLDESRTNNAGTEAEKEAERTAQEAWESSAEALAAAEVNVSVAENDVAMRETLLAQSRRNREAIEAARDSAFASALAGTGTSGQFSRPDAERQLSLDATTAIAQAVESMVTTVINKPYTGEACMSLITWMPDDLDNWSEKRIAYLSGLREICRDVLLADFGTRVTVAFQADEATDRIVTWLEADENNRELLGEWLEPQGIDRVSDLLYSAEHEQKRQEAIRRFRIPQLSPGES